MVRACLIAALVFALGSCRSPEPEAPSPPPHPDVLLVVLDTVRADRTGTGGHARPTSPQLDAVGEAGVRFLDVTAPGSWTWPVHATLFTGVPPWEHGAHFPAPGDPSMEGFPRPREELPTLAETFAAAGYRTVSYSANCLLDPALGLMRGFQEARCLDEPGAVERAVIQELRSERDAPLFLFVNLMPPHGPYHVSATSWARPWAEVLTPERAPAWVRPYLTEDSPGVDLQKAPAGEGSGAVIRFLRGDLSIPEEGWKMLMDLYDGEITEADKRLNVILKTWTETRPRGVVAVTSDHGEAFGEHGLLEHRGNVYSPVTRVPLVLAAPGRLGEGRRVEAPVSLTDLPPTLLTLAGLSADSRGLLPVMEGEAPEPVQAAAWPGPVRARLVGGRHARTWYLYREDSLALVFDALGNTELYDLEADPLMKNDLARELPRPAARLYQRARDAFSERDGAPPRAVTGSVKERLQALGYLDGGQGGPEQGDVGFR